MRCLLYAHLYPAGYADSRKECIPNSCRFAVRVDCMLIYIQLLLIVLHSINSSCKSQVPISKKVTAVCRVTTHPSHAPFLVYRPSLWSLVPNPKASPKASPNDSLNANPNNLAPKPTCTAKPTPLSLSWWAPCCVCLLQSAAAEPTPGGGVQVYTGEAKEKVEEKAEEKAAEKAAQTAREKLENDSIAEDDDTGGAVLVDEAGLDRVRTYA